jgi:hypothetical protein
MARTSQQTKSTPQHFICDFSEGDFNEWVIPEDLTDEQLTKGKMPTYTCDNSMQADSDDPENQA